MSTQQIFLQDPQTPFGFAENPQSPIAFPLSLVEKYQPRYLNDLIGLPGPRRVLDALIKAPRPCSMLFVGNPGVGKTIAGLCFADTLGASLVHISSQKCDVATLDSLRDRFAYCPPKGDFWVCLIDEADQMSEKAQVQLLSRLDATASLSVGFGGASVRTSQPPIIWIFTANGVGENGTVPPASFEKRFLSRCMVIPFEPPTDKDLSQFLQSVWVQETDTPADPAYFDFLARGGAMRESMMMMQVDLLSGAPRPIEPIKTKSHAAKPIEQSAGRYIPQWKRIYAGRASDHLNRIQRHLVAHDIEPLVRQVRTSNKPSAPKQPCLLVRRDDYSRAMTLVAQMKQKG